MGLLGIAIKRGTHRFITVMGLAILLMGIVPSDAGVISTNITLPDNLNMACEHPWTIRLLEYHPTPVMPRRMYFTASALGTAGASMTISLSVGLDSNTTALLMQVPFNAGAARLEPVISKYRHFPDYLEGHGVASSADGSSLALLARRPFGTSTAGTFDKDLLEGHNWNDWMTPAGRNAECAVKEAEMKISQMWLLDWEGGDMSTDPGKYILHKSIGSWEYGNNYMIFGENDNSWGIGVKAMVFDPNCGPHEADAFMVVNRADMTLTTRGYSWACGTGHTMQNRLVYQPGTKKYGIFCSTDYNGDATPNLATIYMHVEGEQEQEVHIFNVNGLRQKGGNTTPQPAYDGSGFVGVLVGINGTVTRVDGGQTPEAPPTSIGIARFNADGSLIGSIKWVVTSDNIYYSYPQLTPLGNDKWLLGYGMMYDITTGDDWNNEKFRVPQEFYLQELDADFEPLSAPMPLDSVGWGEQDQMIPLGDGLVGWAYLPDPRQRAQGEYPDCASTSMSLNVYSSADVVANKKIPNQISPSVNFRQGEGLVVTGPKSEIVQLVVFDPRGRQYMWSGLVNEVGTFGVDGAGLSSGVYGYRLKSSRGVHRGRVVVLE